MNDLRWRALAAIGAALLTILPFAMASGGAVLVNSLAADTFYYLQIARQWHEVGFPSFDGRTATNGFMPLWQGILWLATGGVSDPVPGMRIAFGLSLVAVTVATGALVWTLSAHLKGWRVFGIVPLFVPGVVYVLTAPGFQPDVAPGIMYGLATWSMVNGMETGVGLLAFALTLPLLWRIGPELSRKGGFLLGLGAALVFLARLDDVFYGLALGLAILLLAPRAFVAFAAAPLVLGGGYLVLNVSVFGGLFPSSGVAKTALFSFPLPLGAPTSAEMMRLVPTLFLALIGLFGLLVPWLLGLTGRGVRVAAILSGYLLLKYAFLLSSVPPIAQGYWYYGVGYGAANVIAALAMVPLLRRDRLAVAPVLAGLVIAGVATVSHANRLAPLDPGRHAALTQHLCRMSDRFADALPADARVIDTLDGVYAYCLQRPGISLTGLGASREALAARAAQGFFAAALSDGPVYLADSNLPFANYPYADQLSASGATATLVQEDGPVRIWRIAP